jgi:hypothetical protein
VIVEKRLQVVVGQVPDEAIIVEKQPGASTHAMQIALRNPGCRRDLRSQEFEAMGEKKPRVAAAVYTAEAAIGMHEIGGEVHRPAQRFQHLGIMALTVILGQEIDAGRVISWVTALVLWKPASTDCQLTAGQDAPEPVTEDLFPVSSATL